MKHVTAYLTVATVAAGGLVGLVPATAQAATVERHATLYGSATYPKAHGWDGWAEYERTTTSSGTERELEVTAVHLGKLAGKYVVVFANGHKVGRIHVSSTGYAHREWETDRGQYVPRLSAGDPTRVRTTTGVLVLRGHF